MLWPHPSIFFFNSSTPARLLPLALQSECSRFLRTVAMIFTAAPGVLGLAEIRVRPLIETYTLEKVAGRYARMMGANA